MNTLSETSTTEKVIELLAQLPTDQSFLLPFGSLIVAGLALYLAIIVVKSKDGGQQ